MYILEFFTHAKFKLNNLKIKSCLLIKKTKGKVSNEKLINVKYSSTVSFDQLRRSRLNTSSL